MSEKFEGRLSHLAGLGIAIVATVLIVWVWQGGLQFLIGTSLSELRFFLFAGFVAALLTGIHRLAERFLH